MNRSAIMISDIFKIIYGFKEEPEKGQKTEEVKYNLYHIYWII